MSNNPADIQDTIIQDMMTAIIDKAVRAQYAVLEERLLRVFGSKDVAERELRDSPLSLYQTPEGNLRGELPTLCMMFTCRLCGAERAGPSIWTPEDLRGSKAMYGKWKWHACWQEADKAKTP